jgi:hypothetical protein
MAKNYRNLYEQIIADDNIYLAWRKARRGKHYKSASCNRTQAKKSDVPLHVPTLNANHHVYKATIIRKQARISSQYVRINASICLVMLLMMVK